MLPAGAVSVTVPPSQKLSGPLAAIAALGTGLIVIVAGAEVAEQPLLVTVTVLAPADEAVIDDVVAPLLHK